MRVNKGGAFPYIIFCMERERERERERGGGGDRGSTDRQTDRQS